MNPASFTCAALILLLFTGCSSSASHPRSDRGLPASSGGPAETLGNGIYAILSQSETDAGAEAEAGTAPHLVLPYDQNYTEAPDSPREWIALSPSPYVPFVLIGEPTMGKSEKGFASLSIALAPENARLLEDFTREHLNGRVAIVIGGEVITMHKVKAIVTGGELQITRCGDNACEVLRTKLLQR